MIDNSYYGAAAMALPIMLANFSSNTGVFTADPDTITRPAVHDTRFAGVTWDDGNWILTTTTLDQGHYQSRMSLANGYIGINVAALGPFFEYDQPVNGDNINGWPLFNRRQAFATVGGFWDSQPKLNGTNFPWLDQYGWDSAISGLPHWSGILLDVGSGSVLRAGTPSSQISDFMSSLDMKHGVMNWAYTWSPSPQANFDITYQMFLHKVHVNQAFVSMNITAHSDAHVTVVNVLDGDCATRTEFVDEGMDGELLYSAVSPQGVPNVEAYVYSQMVVSGTSSPVTDGTSSLASYTGRNQSSAAYSRIVSLKAGETVNVVKYVGVASSDAYTDPKQVAKDAVLAASKDGYSSAIVSHAAEWLTLFPESSVDDYTYPNGTLPDDPYILEAQIMAVTNSYYLLQNTISESAQSAQPDADINSHSIMVSGLASDSYAGQIFWDAEIWMQPGFVATFPYAARGIANYRVAKYAQAQRNTQTAYQSSKNYTTFSETGAIYPWTSGRVGNCTATGPCWDYEYHINGDIALEFTNYLITSGDAEFFKEKLFPIMYSVAITYSEILQLNSTVSRYELKNMTDPDEFADHVNNGAFTMALMDHIFRDANLFRSQYNETTNTTWSRQAQDLLISRDMTTDITLEYTDMLNNISVKQADVVLMTFPLSYARGYTTQNSLLDLDYYAAKQSQDGPGMTYSVFSIVANEVSPSGCNSYTYQHYSTYPYVRAPWFQLSEQLIDDFDTNGGFHPAFPFLTGHGGADQVVLFGYLGFRLVLDDKLHVDPNIPPQIPQIRYRTFYWQGWPLQAFSNQTHTVLSRPDSASFKSASGVFPNSAYASSSIVVAVGPVNGNQTMYQLPPNGTLTIQNPRRSDLKSVANNVAQCQPVTSTSDTIPGQFAISAVDGASSTTWQPILANQTASITVSLEPGLLVDHMSFEWMSAVPYYISINFNNRTSPADLGLQIIRNAEVVVENPYGSIDHTVIQIPQGNHSAIYFSNGTLENIDGQLLASELYTAKYATLGIWGSRFNGSLTAANMSGRGATVAEWNIVVV